MQRLPIWTMNQAMVDATASPSVDIALTVLDGRWSKALPEVKAVARRAAAAALEKMALPKGPAELSLALMDDEAMRALNRDYRDTDAPTNVLSFAGDPIRGDEGGSPAMLGDVVIAFETASAEAKTQEKTLSDHLSHLVVHGVLHLLGHDHMDDSAADEMERLERDILARLGIADPYAGEVHPCVAGEAR